MPKPIVLRDEDTDRIRALLVDSPNGVRLADVARALGLGQQRVIAHLSAGRKAGLFILCRTGGTRWYSCAYAGAVRAKQAAALVAEVERRRAQNKAWYAAKQAREDAEDVDLLPVRRVVGRGWTPPPAAPGPTSVFTLGGCPLSNC